MAEPGLIVRREYDAAELVADYPPQWADPNKQFVYSMACPPERPPTGRIAYSRWRAADLPDEAGRHAGLRIEARADLYDYDPSVPGADEWHVNFADPYLFCAYGSNLFAQDEMQVVEHPALGSLLEALVKDGQEALTIQRGRPTPVLIRGVERRCAIATDPSPAEGRPTGLYGNAFARADREAVRRALRVIDPPTISNIIAISALPGGYGSYSRDDIHFTLITAWTGFRAAVVESARCTGRAPVVVHTGFWGCGAFGGNRTLTPALQLIAAHLAGVDRLVFHAHNQAGVEQFQGARRMTEELLGRGEPRPTRELIADLLEMNFQWGQSDGN